MRVKDCVCPGRSVQVKDPQVKTHEAKNLKKGTKQITGLTDEDTLSGNHKERNKINNRTHRQSGNHKEMNKINSQQ